MSRPIIRRRRGLSGAALLQYATTTFLPMRKPCCSRSQVSSLRTYRQTNGPRDQVIPASRTFSVEQHPSGDATVSICACPGAPRTKRRCLSNEAVAGKLSAARARERTFNVIGSSSEYVLLDQLRLC